MAALRASRILMKAIKAAQQAEELNDVNDHENNGELTMADEDSVLTHIFDCVALVAAMQQGQHIPANLADARIARNKVFMGALSVVGNSLLKVDGMEELKQTNAAIDQLLKAFPVLEKKPYIINKNREG